MTDEEARYRLSGDYSDMKEKYISLRRIHTELHVKYKKVEDENKTLKEKNHSLIGRIKKLEAIESPSMKLRRQALLTQEWMYKYGTIERMNTQLREQVKQLQNDRRSAVVDKTT